MGMQKQQALCIFETLAVSVYVGALNDDDDDDDSCSFGPVFVVYKCRKILQSRCDIRRNDADRRATSLIDCDFVQALQWCRRRLSEPGFAATNKHSGIMRTWGRVFGSFVPFTMLALAGAGRAPMQAPDLPEGVRECLLSFVFFLDKSSLSHKESNVCVEQFCPSDTGTVTATTGGT